MSCDNTSKSGRTCAVRLCVVFLLTGYACALAWSAWKHSPTVDEVGHLAGGLYVWEFGKYDVYRVNPPLVRVLAAIPCVLSSAKTDWSLYAVGLRSRPEWTLGKSFIEANAESWRRYYTLARWAVIPICLVGACVCLRWATDLYGATAGLISLTLWCFSPNILAWGATITPDASAAALGVLAEYLFWKWLKTPEWNRAVSAGLSLGLAELTKFTWLVLFGVWPILWIAWTLGNRLGTWRKSGTQLLVSLLFSFAVLNLGYGFEGSFQPLGRYKFTSRVLAGSDAIADHGRGGNRFSQTWLSHIPIPVPKHYISGIDLQKLDFERGAQSYLNGEWKHGGWWYYYMYALLLKVPLGTSALFMLAAGLTVARARQFSNGWKSEWVLLVPAIVVFLVVSSQTGVNRDLRYVLPCFPFVFVWISKVGRFLVLRHWGIGVAAGIACSCSICSSLWVYPHSMSYFNLLAGGPMEGHRHLVDGNIDWGQDLFYLEEWYDAHPEARPLRMALHTPINLQRFGFADVSQAPMSPRANCVADDRTEYGPQPGWFAISVHRLHQPDGRYEYFLKYFTPVAHAGYSIYIYHITFDEANRVRREIGLASLSKMGRARVGFR